MSKKRLELNQNIAALVQKKVDNNETWTREEIKYVQQYTGAGGTKISRGALYEYYTPQIVVSKMWALAYHHGFKNGYILEPSCGIGRFLNHVNPSLDYVDAFEFSKDNDTSFQIAKATYPFANITNDYFESIFYRGNFRVGTNKRYDLVIGNPPYGQFTGKYASQSREGSKFSGKTYDQYFLWAGIELLNSGGLLVYIIPSSFLDNGSSYESFKDEIYTKADLLSAYRLPKGIFDHTELQTDIVVFKKR